MNLLNLLAGLGLSFGKKYRWTVWVRWWYWKDGDQGEFAKALNGAWLTNAGMCNWLKNELPKTPVLLPDHSYKYFSAEPWTTYVIVQREYVGPQFTESVKYEGFLGHVRPKMGCSS